MALYYVPGSYPSGSLLGSIHPPARSRPPPDRSYVPFPRKQRIERAAPSPAPAASPGLIVTGAHWLPTGLATLLESHADCFYILLMHCTSAAVARVICTCRSFAVAVFGWQGAEAMRQAQIRERPNASYYAHHSPLVIHYSTLHTHYSPLTTHQSPVTNHQPLTTHHPPPATHHSLLTNHHSLLPSTHSFITGCS